MIIHPHQDVRSQQTHNIAAPVPVCCHETWRTVCYCWAKFCHPKYMIEQIYHTTLTLNPISPITEATDSWLACGCHLTYRIHTNPLTTVTAPPMSVTLAIPEHFLLCGRAHCPVGGALPSGSVVAMRGCTWSAPVFGWICVSSCFPSEHCIVPS